MTKETKSAVTIGGISLVIVAVVLVVLGGGSDQEASVGTGMHSHDGGPPHADHGPTPANPEQATQPTPAVRAETTQGHSHGDGYVHTH